jgi:hypothetical protein
LILRRANPIVLVYGLEHLFTKGNILALSQRRIVTSRLQRFQINQPLTVIVKNARSRMTCFWFNLSNVSASGVGISYGGNGFIPYQVGDVLQLTVDLTSVVFSRPIHITVIVRRKVENRKMLNGRECSEIFFGAEIIKGDELHNGVWLEGLSKLGDPFKEDDHSAGKARAIG